MLALPVMLIGTGFSSILLGLREIGILSTLRVFQAAATVPLLFVLVRILGFGVGGAVGATVLTNFLFAIAGAAVVRTRGATFLPRLAPEVVRPTLQYGLRSYVGNLLQFFNYRLDLFVVNAFVGAAGAGIYSTAVMLAELLWQFPNSVGTVMFPKAAGTTSAEMDRFTPKVFWIVLAISSCGGLFLALTGRVLIRLIFSQQFASAYVPMLALLPGVVLIGASKVLTNDIAGRGFPHYNSIAAAASVVLTLTLDFLFVPKWGVLGASFASTVAYTATFVLSLFFSATVRRMNHAPAVDRMRD
jgi:O-antigen/teichoic acid export membrane protein